MQLARTEQQIALPTSWSALPMGDWVAAELYQLTPPEFAAMVRRELQRLNTQQSD